MRGKITTLNIHAPSCIGKQASDLIEVLNKDQPDILVIQEAWKINLRRFLPNGFATNQITNGSRDKGGPAVVWRKDKFSLKGTNLIFGCSAPPGTVMATRWFSVATLKNDKTGRVTKVAACHFPARQTPIETRLQGPMAARMVNWYKNAGTNNVVIGGDFNFLIQDDPWGISKKTNLIRRGPRIDGFYLPPSMDPSAISRGDNIFSAHYPFSIWLDI